MHEIFYFILFYFIFFIFTTLSRTHPIVAYGPHKTMVYLYLVFQHFPVDLNRLSSRWSSTVHETGVHTHFFDFKHVGVKMNGGINVCINGSQLARMKK